MQSSRFPGKDRTFLGATFIANGNDISESLPRFQNIRDGLCFLVRDIDSDFTHRFDHQWIERAWFESGALGIKRFATQLIEPCFGHLAAGAVVHANEKHLLFHVIVDLRINAESGNNDSIPALIDNSWRVATEKVH